ncbi:hypothetical protein [Flavobacterium gyeonganense]|uniref:DUF4760 domain-containing protein n=1 Tax=Flavobacterium gyeonganense TaxID=1310418 RepID=A0ABV5H774_9FLAO|nr:hypothetical protein [Flavobacterium gyeonganense]
MEDLLKTILGSSIVTTILTSAIVYYFHKKTERSNAVIKHEFDRISQIHNTDFEWRKKTTELLGQVYTHLNRTRLAFENTYSRLEKYDAKFEDEIMYNSNKKIRDILLENGHHLPPELLGEASKLIEHYDAWLVKYHHLRKMNEDKNTIHIYVGTDRFPFPKKAEGMFKEKYEEMFQKIRQL